MGQITVKAAARVLGLQLGQVATFEETPLLRSLITSGKLVDQAPPAEPSAAEPATEATGEADPGEGASRAKHPAGRRLQDPGTAAPETGEAA